MADPILDKVVQLLADRRARYPAEWAKLRPEDLDAFIKEETNGKYGLHDLTDVSARNLGRSLFQGATFNFGDELTGLLGGNENEMRLRDELFEKAHPLADAASSVVGSLPLLAIPGLGEAGEGAGIGAAIKAGAKAGALAGGLYGAGAGESAPERFVKGATGAAAGGVLGAAIPGVLASAKAAFNPATTATRRMVGAIQASGGVQKLLDELELLKSTGRGDIAMLADLSPRLAQEGDFAANNSDAALLDAAQKIQGRQRDQAGRLLADVREKVGDPIAAQRQQDLSDATSDWAREAYGAIEAAHPTVDPSAIAGFLNKPGVRDAYAHARLAGDITADSPLDQLMQKLQAANPGVSAKQIEHGLTILGGVPGSSGPRAVSFTDLQQLKRILDDRVTKAYREGNGELAKSYKTVRDAVKGALVDQVPEYAAVDAQYAAKKSVEKMVDQGIEAWDEDDTRRLSDEMGTMTSDELREFRLAMASELIARLRSARTNQDMARRLLTGGQALEDKLKVVFGTPEVFDDFMRRLGVEGETFNRVKGAIGGSATARRVGARLSALGFEPGEVFGSAVTGGPAAVQAKLLSQLVRSARAAHIRNTAGLEGSQLFAQGAPSIESILAALTHPQSLLTRAQTRAATPVASLFDNVYNFANQNR